MAEPVYSVPRTRLVKWMAKASCELPEEVQATLVRSLFSSLPIFVGGVANTLIVSLLCAVRLRSPPVLIWAAFEALICFARVATLVWSNRQAAAARPTATDLHMVLALCWASSVGLGAFIGLVSGDWIVATMTCLSAAAMIGGMCVRNFAAPRYVFIMIALSSAPLCLGAVLSGQRLALVVLIQAPMYAFVMTAAAYHLNRLLVSTMLSGIQQAERAKRDELTGLLNRAGLDANCREERSDATSASGGFAVFYLDLDLFKAVNDSYGHSAGDCVLRAVSARLRRVFRPSDQIARIGGDEFVVAAREITEIEAHQLADRVVKALTEPFPVPGGAARIGASVGLAFADMSERRDFDELLARADRALYKAKEDGRSRYRAFHDGNMAA